MNKLIRLLLIVMAVITVGTTVVSAATVPYKTWTFSSEGAALSSPTAYVPDMVIDSEYMGLEVAASSLTDLFVGPDDKVYLVDSTAGRVIVLDKYFRFEFEINTFINEHGVRDTFSNPQGIFADEKYIYVCDTDNNRIVIFTIDGEYHSIIGKPESPLFGTDAIYKPVAIAADDYGRLFIVSSTTYQGIIVLNMKGEFFGFIGAQKVTISALELLWRSFQTDDAFFC